MQISLTMEAESKTVPIVSFDGVSWYKAYELVPDLMSADVMDILLFEKENAGSMEQIAALRGVSSVGLDGQESILPFQPRAYRDFMLYETHFVNATRGFVKKYLPKLMPMVTAYETVFNKPFPKFKPKKRWYKYPIYYLGNHLNFVTDKEAIKIPEYTQELDYEL